MVEEIKAKYKFNFFDIVDKTVAEEQEKPKDAKKPLKSTEEKVNSWKNVFKNFFKKLKAKVEIRTMGKDIYRANTDAEKELNIEALSAKISGYVLLLTDIAESKEMQEARKIRLKEEMFNAATKKDIQDIIKREIEISTSGEVEAQFDSSSSQTDDTQREQVEEKPKVEQTTEEDKKDSVPVNPPSDTDQITPVYPTASAAAMKAFEEIVKEAMEKVVEHKNDDTNALLNDVNETINHNTENNPYLNHNYDSFGQQSKYVKGSYDTFEVPIPKYVETVDRVVDNWKEHYTLGQAAGREKLKTIRKKADAKAASIREKAENKINPYINKATDKIDTAKNVVDNWKEHYSLGQAAGREKLKTIRKEADAKAASIREKANAVKENEKIKYAKEKGHEFLKNRREERNKIRFALDVGELSLKGARKARKRQAENAAKFEIQTSPKQIDIGTKNLSIENGDISTLISNMKKAEEIAATLQENNTNKEMIIAKTSGQADNYDKKQQEKMKEIEEKVKQRTELAEASIQQYESLASILDEQIAAEEERREQNKAKYEAATELAKELAGGRKRK